MDHPLTGMRVLDRSTGIAGGYCTKLLADAGADVVKVEPASGDPLRQRNDGRLFAYLHTSKRGIVVDDDQFRALARTADVVVTSDGSLDHQTLADDNPRLSLLSITPFGRTGPWAGRPATEFTLLAQAGSTATRALPGRVPINAGGQIGEWLTGITAAVAILADRHRAAATGRGADIDLSMLEVVTPTCTNVQSVWGSFTGIYDTDALVEVPSIEPTADGHVGFCIFTGQQWNDFTVLIGHPELADDPELATMGGRLRRGQPILDTIRAWTTTHTTAEIVELAALLRIPVAPIGNGANLPTMEHFADRGVYVENPSGRFVQPRVPYRIQGAPTRRFTPAPELGADTAAVLAEAARGSAADPAPATTPIAGGPTWPLTGVRVVDLTAFWAGPYATFALSTIGADVIHVESVQRPDGMRFGSAREPGDGDWWEFGPTFHAANAGKRSVTLDLTRSVGRDLLRRLIEVSDVLVENFSPRVIEQFGLDWDTVRGWNPRLIMVRMPAFGLDGPWRDRVGFAQTMEQISGMAWLTGYADSDPMNARGPCDPLAGLHAAFAALVGLHRRARTGAGAFIEATMVETALNAAAEQVIEHSATGELLTRDGNHHHGIGPQGVYPTADQPADTKGAVAVAIDTDAQWRALTDLIDLGGLDRTDLDGFDERLATWCAARTLDEAVASFHTAGVPAAPVVAARAGDRSPQHEARGFYEAITHPLAGTHRIAAFPARFAGQPTARFARPAPTLGEHNREVLGDLLGVTDDELARLEADQIIGTRPVRG